jgi:hypothetical protein
MAEAIPRATYPQYTNRALGEGLFDQLMATVNEHLETEFDKNRLSGDQWAKVFLGSMESVMANTTQYLLGSLLIEQKKEQIELGNAQIELENEKLQYEITHLLPLLKSKQEKELEVLDKQMEKIDKEIEFLTQKIATEKANVDATDVLPNSVVGRQMALLKSQQYGFAGNLQKGAAKMHADFQGIYQSVMEPTITNGAKLNLDTQTELDKVDDTAQAIYDLP